MLPYFKPYHKATATKTTEYWQNNAHIEKHDKEPRNRSNKYSQLTFDKGNSVEKRESFSTREARTFKYFCVKNEPRHAPYALHNNELNWIIDLV